jgi:hypothetical protein
MRINESWYAILDDIAVVRGIVEPLNALAVRYIYEDKKIKVEGFLRPARDGYGWEFRMFVVSIKIPSKINNQVFGMEAKTNEDTIVYLADVKHRDGNVPWLYEHHYRPGKWEEYLNNIAEGIKAERRKYSELDGKPIDDIQLFSDIE